MVALDQRGDRAQAAHGVGIQRPDFIGHRRAPIAIYFDMLLALIVIGTSVVIVRGWL